MPNFLDDYEPVDSRIHRFWEKHPNGRIITHLEDIRIDDAGRTLCVVCRCEVFRNDPAEIGDRVDAIRYADATGYAEESIATSSAPKGSIVETCETSAIGRALANLGFSAKGSRPSREEMQKAERHTQPDRPDDRPQYGPRPASGKQVSYLIDLVAKHRLDCEVPGNLTAGEAKEAIDHILKLKTVPPGFGIDVADDYPDEEPF